MEDGEKQWRLLLKNIGLNLRTEDIKTVVFIESIPDGVAEGIKDGVKLFKDLEQYGVIDMKNPIKLKEILNYIPRNDLQHYLLNYMTQLEENFVTVKQKPKQRRPRSDVPLMKPSDFTSQLSSEKGQKENAAAELPDERTPFKMAATPRGICLIISNQEFDPVPNENETQNDILQKGLENLDISGGQKKTIPQEHVNRAEELVEEGEFPNPTQPQDYSNSQRDVENDGKGANDNTDDYSEGNDKDGIGKPKDDNRYERKGTTHDEVNLEKTFKWLEFKVEKKRNCKGREILDVLKKYAKNVDHSQYDAFICCLLSHGYEEGVFGTDWERVDLLEIRKIFKGGTLLDKPKLFIIQSCRGKDIDRGVLKSTGPTESDETGTMPTTANTFFDDDPGEVPCKKGSYAEAPDSGQPLKKSVVAPADNNFLFALPCAPGNKAINNDDDGSWFIGKLCEKLQQYAHEDDLQTISNYVVHAVSQLTAFGEEVHGRYKATPEFRFTFARKLYFHPPLKWEDYIKATGSN